MKKRILIILLLTGGIDLLFIACCPGPYFGYLQIDSITLQTENLGVVTHGETVPFDDFMLGLEIKTSTMAASTFNSVFMSTAYAMTKCPVDGDMGLRTAIEKVTISTNVAVFGITAGQPINVDGHIKVHNKFKVKNGKKEPLDFQDWIGALNTNYYITDEKWNFLFEEALPLNEQLHFEIELLFEDGKRLKATTGNVILD